MLTNIQQPCALYLVFGKGGAPQRNLYTKIEDVYRHGYEKLLANCLEGLTTIISSEFHHGGHADELHSVVKPS